jgi:hypothetical protein
MRIDIEFTIKIQIKTQCKPLSPSTGRGEQDQKMWVKMSAIAPVFQLLDIRREPGYRPSAIRLFHSKTHTVVLTTHHWGGIAGLGIAPA